METFERQIAISDFIERVKNGTVDFDSACIIIDGLTYEERERIRNIIIVESIVDQICEGRQRYDLSRLVKYIDESKPNPNYVEQSETTPQPQSDKVINALAEIYDLLISENVISEKTSKIEFVNVTLKGGIPTITNKGKTKFKAYIKLVRPYFNVCWFDSVCKNANMSEKQMGKFNGERTRKLCQDLQLIIEKKM